ncbi:hypothetical protein Btru_076785 [Bulinus truncatus]|nr:hypothetical protein Btru_076785 [Bulinus truncatus]
MENILQFIVLIISLSFVLCQNVPNDPLWPVFAQSLSAQTGRTVQDINTLGLSDSSINFLWTGYKANMPSYVSLPPTTTPPPLPDLYQTSYSFSSNSINQPPPNPTPPPAATSTSDLYNTLLNVINQATPTSTAQNTGITSTQDVMKAYSQMAASGASQVDPMAMLKGTTSGTRGTPDVTSLMQQYAAIMGQNAPTQAAQPSTTGGATQDMSLLLQQYASSVGSTNTPSYSQLLQQYNQIMSSATPAPPTSSPSGQLTPELLMQLYSRMTSSSSSPGSPQPTPSSATTTTNATTASAPPPATFEQQLAEFFPQFKNMFPSQQSPAANATANSTADNTQMIFDTLLFGPTMATGAPPTVGKTPLPSVPNPMVNLISPTDLNGPSLISNHVENVFKTRASREMGCRFLPELLELDVLPTAPIDCIGKCPFPYINAQKFGVYCLCCPPGVNEQLAGIMSIFRRSSYIETPLAVI